MPTIRADAAEQIDAYLEKAAPFARAIGIKLRKLIHQADKRIVEDWKWGPNFNCNGMVCGFGAFKQHVALTFFKGVLMKDPHGLFRPADNASTRSIEFTDAADIKDKAILAYVKEAVALNEAGAKPVKREIKVVVPAELKKALAQNKQAKAAFNGLAPSCRREYAEYIADAKKPETRARRLEKTLAQLAEGKALNEKYKNC